MSRACSARRSAWASFLASARHGSRVVFGEDAWARLAGDAFLGVFLGDLLWLEKTYFSLGRGRLVLFGGNAFGWGDPCLGWLKGNHSWWFLKGNQMEGEICLGRCSDSTTMELLVLGNAADPEYP